MVGTDMPDGESMQEIQTLTSLTNALNNWGIALLAMTALVAVAYCVVSFVAIRKSSTLIRLKDQQLTRDLKEKDNKIADAVNHAAQANVKAQALEHDNLNLRKDLNVAIGKVASLQKDAADAKAAQQRVEIELDKQRERAADAERSLLELQERLRPRQLSAEQRKQLIEILSKAHKAPIEVSGLAGDAESHAFAQQIKDVLKRSAWTTPSVGTFTVAGDLVGVEVRVHSPGSSPPHAMVVQSALESVGIPCVRSEGVDVEEGLVKIWVGHKP